MDGKFLPLNQETTLPWLNDIHNLAANLLSKKYGVIPKTYADLDMPIIITPVTVSSLSVTSAGSRAFVTDATTTTFGTIAVGGGTNKVPVYSDGTNWRIG